MDRNRQQNTVSAAFALGLAALEMNELPGGKPSFDLAFMRYWRRWPYAHLFPSVTGPSPLDPWWLVQEYTERKRTPLASLFWEGGLVYRYHEESLSDPTWEELADGLVDEIPGDEWLRLVREIVEYVED